MQSPNYELILIECEKYKDDNNQKGQQFIAVFLMKIIFSLLIFQ